MVRELNPNCGRMTVFPPIVENLSPGGVFVTYSAKGSVRRVLERLGMTVSLVQGPPGKREMIQAVRPLL